MSQYSTINVWIRGICGEWTVRVLTAMLKKVSTNTDTADVSVATSPSFL